MGFFLCGDLTGKIAFVSLRSAQHPAREAHGEVQVLKARTLCSIPSLQEKAPVNNKHTGAS